MAFLIGGANSAADTGFSVDNSCRFDGSTAYMSKTMGTATNRLKLTMSVWLKRSTLGASVFFSSYYSASYRFQFYFDGSDRLAVLNVDGGSTNVSLITNRVFRDVSSYYHVQAVIDTTEASSSNRVKLYVNGTQETSFSTATYPAENADMSLGASSYTANIGRYGGDSDYFSGYMAEFVYLDGQTLAPTSCGEFDEDSPTIWKPIDVSELTFGDEGIYCDFEDSDNLGDDESGNTSDLAETNVAATDQASDSPTNNFCVMNSLTASSYSTLSEGNTKTAGNSASDNGNVVATIVPSSGKWYCECKIGNKQGTGYPSIGMAQEDDPNFGTVLNSTVGTAGYNGTSSGIYRPDGQKYSNNSTAAFGSGNSFDTDDIMMMAMDCDNGAFYIGKNGSWISDGTNTGDPASAGSKTGAFLTWTPADETGQTFATRDYDDSVLLWNFGNPTYANSSDAADANGYGAFEYAPPSGYFALCTKNLAEYG